MQPAAAAETEAYDGQPAPRTEVRVGLRLGAARERQGLSLREVARRTGLSPSFISQVERDRVTPFFASLKQLAAALGERVGCCSPPARCSSPTSC
jgi:ribosome-binding protein aMBF1 (putative translation factor)